MILLLVNIFFLVLAIICLYFYKKAIRSLKNDIICLLIMLAIFMVCNAGLEEMTLSPNQKMTNGNLAYVIWLPTIIVLFTILILTRKIVKQLYHRAAPTSSTLFRFAGGMIFFLSCGIQYYFLKDNIAELVQLQVFDSAHLNKYLFNKYLVLTFLGLGMIWGVTKDENKTPRKSIWE